MNHSQIKGLLPHRHPILLVDQVIEIETEKMIVAEKNITATVPCFQSIDDECYKEDAYNYPNSLIIESFCQAACILALESKQINIKKSELVPLFGSLNNVEFISIAKPGDKLIHNVNWITSMEDTVVVNGNILNGDEVLATVDMAILAFKPMHRFTTGAVVEVENHNGS